MKCLIIIIFVMNHSVMTEQLLRFNYYWWQHDFSCNLVLISTSKFFKGNKIAHAERASAIYSLWKNLQELIYAKLHKNSCCYLSIIYTKFMMEKNWQHAVTICNFQLCYNFALLLQLCTLVTTLHQYYIKMLSFLASQTHEIFSCMVIRESKLLWWWMFLLEIFNRKIIQTSLSIMFWPFQWKVLWKW